MRAAAATRFTVAPELSADAPPEARGLARDGVRLLVAHDDRPLRHLRFTDLPSALAPGDLVVVNTSDTEPAAIDGHRADGRRVVLHVSGPAPGGGFVVELRTPDGGRVVDAAAGEAVELPRDVTAVLRTGYPDVGVSAGSRLWRAVIPVEGGVPRWLAAVGRPIQYSYLRGRWPLVAYRTIFATRAREPAHAEFAHAEFAPTELTDAELVHSELTHTELASAEMPSAGRPFSPAVLDDLRVRGVAVAEVVLHTGVSSLEADEVSPAERYRVPAATATAVNTARAEGARVVAVGTTVTRALETAADASGTVHPGDGWTDLVLGPERPARVVDGLVTGWHEPDTSHLLLLEAVAGARLVGRAYAAAVDRGYLWHEFGDSCLLLPARHDRPVARRPG